MRLLAALSAALLPLAAAQARTLTVGEGLEYPSPSAAIAAAAEGDTVSIAPGEYFDCAVVDHARLTIEGSAPGAVLTDKQCMGKGLLVVRAAGTTVRNLTLARARVPDGNGAGIRLEAPDLLLQGVTFENDQVGLLSGMPAGTVRIEDSRFHAGGVGGDRPKFAVMVDGAELLQITGCTFEDVKGGQVVTGADRTELRGNTIQTGAGELPAAAVQAMRGALTMQDNTVVVGPEMPKPEAAVLLYDVASATFRGNRLVNRTGRAIALVRDWSHTAPAFTDNAVPPGDSVVSTGGLFRHRVSSELHERKDQAMDLARSLRNFVKTYVLRR